MEYIYQVDKNDNVIGKVAKNSTDHDPSLIHREVAVIIYDDKDNVILQQRSANKSKDPGKWVTSASGHVTYGQTPLEAAHCELKEELGFDTDLFFTTKEFYEKKDETHFTYWFIGKYFNQDIKIDPKEVADAKFFSKDDLAIKVDTGMDVGKGSYAYMKRFWNGEFDNIKQ